MSRCTAITASHGTMWPPAGLRMFSALCLFLCTTTWCLWGLSLKWLQLSWEIIPHFYNPKYFWVFLQLRFCLHIQSWLRSSVQSIWSSYTQVDFSGLPLLWCKPPWGFPFWKTKTKHTKKYNTNKNSATCRRTPTCSARMKLTLATFHG